MTERMKIMLAFAAGMLAAIAATAVALWQHHLWRWQ